MVKVLVATNNRGKVRELAEIFADLKDGLLLPADLGITLDVAETGQTYAENARLKAMAFARASGLISMGDDSGLEVDALAGAPGLHSARYAGPGATDADRRAKLICELHDIPAPRPARFRCVIAVALPNGNVQLFEGTCEGEIILEERGSQGFGYDPIFYLPEYQRTMAELPPEVKNQISHRARAAQAALPYLTTLLKLGGAE
jgi:XTP/dITP diphosphohydrolase